MWEFRIIWKFEIRNYILQCTIMKNTSFMQSCLSVIYLKLSPCNCHKLIWLASFLVGLPLKQYHADIGSPFQDGAILGQVMQMISDWKSCCFSSDGNSQVTSSKGVSKKTQHVLCKSRQQASWSPGLTLMFRQRRIWYASTFVWVKVYCQRCIRNVHLLISH